MQPSCISTNSDSLFSRRRFLSSAAACGIVGLGGTVLAGTWANAAPAFAAEGSDANAPRGIAPYASPSVSDEADRATKRLLVVVDYQVDFVDGGVFGRIEPAVAIEDGLCEVIREYQERDDLIVYTMDTHPSDQYADTREGSVNPPHCVPGTEGWELYGKVRDLLTPHNAIMLKKGTYGSRDLPFVVEAIRSQGIAIETIELAGVSTTCRVLHNAILLYNFFPEIPLIMNEKSTASYTDEATLDQLDELESWGFIVKR